MIHHSLPIVIRFANHPPLVAVKELHLRPYLMYGPCHIHFGPQKNLQNHNYLQKNIHLLESVDQKEFKSSRVQFYYIALTWVFWKTCDTTWKSICRLVKTRLSCKIGVRLWGPLWSGPQGVRLELLTLDPRQQTQAGFPAFLLVQAGLGTAIGWSQLDSEKNQF